MRKKTVQLFPDTIKILEQMGEQIKLARLRRNLSVELVAARANISIHIRIAPFGNLRINSYLLIPAAYRSLSRPSSAPNAKAFSLRSS